MLNIPTWSEIWFLTSGQVDWFGLAFGCALKTRRKYGVLSCRDAHSQSMGDP